ncbi:MAG: alpha-glucan family phosphorylase [Candidatus Omnitrophica bacterium]|nr:alpha-glucan family phosphorylase [Candidatus Omnitrophota bacterium]
MKNDALLQDFLSLVDIDGFSEHYAQDIGNGKYFGMPLEPIVIAEKRLRQAQERNIAYFSMEYGLATSFYNTFKSELPANPLNKIPENTVFSNYRLADYFFAVKVDSLIDLPIYSGGLGVLAGDTVKTMADYKLPASAVGILWHSGYFSQKFWFKYGQVPEKMHWDPRSYPGLIPLKNIITVKLKEEEIRLRLWKYYVYSYKHDYAMPLILLDADLPENSDDKKVLTDQLYRSDNSWIKLMQRAVLGFGGIAALSELGYPIDIFHLNEGHAALAFIAKASGLSEEGIKELKNKFYYTCHTPVQAGHDRFSEEDMRRVLKEEDFNLAQKLGRESSGQINLTLLSMNMSSSINAVSKRHQEVMQLQFPEYKDRIRFVTNGVHPYTWMSKDCLDVIKSFNSVIENVESNPMALAKVRSLKNNQDFRFQLWQAHQKNKSIFCNLLEKWQIKEDVFTICWARRIAAYKRPSLILQDVERLISIAKNIGPLQIVLAGKAHPSDNLAFTFINEMLDKVDALPDSAYDLLKVVILENYDIHMGKLLTSSVDLWLNNPCPPFEASGTSGMKAILNGVVQLSTLDGWVVEAEDLGIGKIFGSRYVEGKLGAEFDSHIKSDANELYDSLEEMAKQYYAINKSGKLDLSSQWIDMMINCIAAGAHFNTYRMLDEYKHMIWNIREKKESVARV